MNTTVRLYLIRRTWWFVCYMVYNFCWYCTCSLQCPVW